jgi:hypothetical protein
LKKRPVHCVEHQHWVGFCFIVFSTWLDRSDVPNHGWDFSPRNAVHRNHVSEKALAWFSANIGTMCHYRQALHLTGPIAPTHLSCDRCAAQKLHFLERTSCVRRSGVVGGAKSSRGTPVEVPGVPAWPHTHLASQATPVATAEIQANAQKSGIESATQTLGAGRVMHLSEVVGPNHMTY